MTTTDEPAPRRPADADPLAAVRLATRSAHRRVDSRLHPACLGSRERYEGLLLALLALHEPWEHRLGELDRRGAFHPWDLALSERGKTQLLRADLGGLGRCVAPRLGGPQHRAPLPLGADPTVATHGHAALEALGAFYVLEGSTLGGRVLAPQVRVALGDVPTSFLDVYGDRSGRRWHEARGVLVTAVATSPQPAAATSVIAAAAGRVFADLDEHLARHGWPLPAQRPIRRGAAQLPVALRG